MEESSTTHYHGASGAAYSLEHTYAWLLIVLATGLVVIGLMVGFGVLGEGSNGGIRYNGDALDPRGDAGETRPAIGQTRADIDLGSFGDALVLLLPGVAAGFVAYSLHSSDHHRRGVASMTRGALFSFEHALAYIMVLGTMGMGALAILVGYDAFGNGNTIEDGILWGIAAVITAGLAATLHSVRHHQTEADEDYLVEIVRERVVQMAPVVAVEAGTPATVIVTEEQQH